MRGHALLSSRRVRLLGLGALTVVLAYAGLFWVGMVEDSEARRPLERRPPMPRVTRPAPKRIPAFVVPPGFTSDQSLPFVLAPGYTAECVAAQPLVVHPVFASLDEEGRLYVAGVAGQQESPDQMKKDLPGVIRRLEDTDGDGRYDRCTVFADKLTFPEGVLVHDGAVFTASPPSLWRLEDTDGDGVVDVRKELVAGFVLTGIADDLHGPCLGPDGRIYWGVGRFPYKIRKPGGSLIREGQAPLIMRCRPDGEQIEVFSTALGNPVEVAFTRTGEPLVSGTSFEPEEDGNGMRDAIIHCVEGGVYPIMGQDAQEDPRTGDLLPAVTHLGLGAPSGLLRAESLGSGARPVLFSALFTFHAVYRHDLERDGSTFTSSDQPFILSKDPDFHPTDILEDADGSLLVVDTGAWFRACPTSQIAKEHVHGAIYRVRRQDGPPVADPRGKSLDWDRAGPEELAERLDDPRFVVRDRAIGRLAKRGEAAVPALREVVQSDRSATARRNAVWTLSRIEGAGAREAVRLALGDHDASVRQAAAVSAGLYRDPAAAGRLTQMVTTDRAPTRREAATALGRIRHAPAVPALLQGLSTSKDPFLDHALVLALMRIDDRAATLPGLRDARPGVRRGALVALHLMEHGGLSAEQVVPFLSAVEPEVQQAAFRVFIAHPEWGEPLLGALRQRLMRPLDAAERAPLLHTLVTLAKDSNVQKFIAAHARSHATPAESRALLFEVIGNASPAKWPASWTDALRDGLADPVERVTREAIAAVDAAGLRDFDPTLLQLGHDRSRSDLLRIDAIGTVAPRLNRLPDAFLELLERDISRERSPFQRLSAAKVLGQAPLSDDQLRQLVGLVPTMDALVLPRLLPVFERSQDGAIGSVLVEALGHSPGLRSVSSGLLDRVLSHYPAEVRRAADPLRQRLGLGESEKVKLLAELLAALGTGDALRGREVFFSTKAACSACHSVHGHGGTVGPDLTRIESVRTPRDLLESIVFPSATISRGYEPYTVATQDGRILTGRIARKTASAILLVAPDRPRQLIRRASIETIEQSRESLMPRGLEANLTQDELSDLIAFLSNPK
jgi:putative membrane-bound dehydrogenase-like protein